MSVPLKDAIELQFSFYKRITTLCGVILPLSFGFLIELSMLIINLIYAGHFRDDNGLAAVGLGQTLCSLVLVTFVYGVASSVATLIT